MKRAELLDLQEQPVEHLRSALQEKQDHLLHQIRMRVAAGEGVNAHEAREARRDIARIKTLIREDELGIREKRNIARKTKESESSAGES